MRGAIILERPQAGRLALQAEHMSDRHSGSRAPGSASPQHMQQCVDLGDYMLVGATQCHTAMQPN